MKRRFTRLMAAFCMCVMLGLMFAGTEANAKTLKSGNYEYEIMESGDVRITKYTGEESKVVIPSELGGKKVTRIGMKAFAVWKEVRPGWFEDVSTVTEVVFPDTLHCIEIYNFANVTSLHVPKNLTAISSRTFSVDKLTRITVDKENKVYDSRNNCNALIQKEYDYDGTGRKDVALVLASKNTVIPNTVEVIGDDAFTAYPNKSIKIPKSVKWIGYCAFFGSKLTEVEIPEGVPVLGGDAFSNCSRLKKMTIPKSVKEICWDFTGVPSNMVICAKKGSYAEKWGIKNGYSVNGNKATKVSPEGREYYVVGAKCKVNVTSKKGEQPAVEYLQTTDTNASTIKIPDTVVIFGIRYKVTSVDNYALYNNKKVKKLIVGKNVNSIGEEAFKNCSRLKSVELQSGTLSEIGEGAFSGDKKLTKITLKTKNLTKKSIGKAALKGTNKKLVIKVPASKVAEYKKYFRGKGNNTVKVRK